MSRGKRHDIDFDLRLAARWDAIKTQRQPAKVKVPRRTVRQSIAAAFRSCAAVLEGKR